jgi:hypothetical protein
MKPNRRNLFRNELTRDRVVPTISASVSCVIGAMTGTGSPSLPKFASSKKRPGKTLFAVIEQVIDQVLFDARVAVRRHGRCRRGRSSHNGYDASGYS